MQILTNDGVSNSLNITSKKSRGLNISLEEKNLLEELTDLLIGKEFYQDQKIKSDFSDDYNDLDFSEDLTLFEYIKVIEITNDEIFFLIKALIIGEKENEGEDKKEDLNVISLNDFFNIFIKENVISLNENKFEIIAKLSDLISIQEEKLNNPASFLYKLKGRVIEVLKIKR